MLWTELDLYNPWREFGKFKEEMNRILSNFREVKTAEFPNINILTGEGNAVLYAEVPGVDPNEIELLINGDTLSLKGERKLKESKEDQLYHRQERYNGKFSRTIKLPFTVDKEKVTAKYKNGVLTINLPQAKTEAQRKITIN